MKLSNTWADIKGKPARVHPELPQPANYHFGMMIRLSASSHAFAVCVAGHEVAGGHVVFQGRLTSNRGHWMTVDGSEWRL